MHSSQDMHYVFQRKGFRLVFHFTLCIKQKEHYRSADGTAQQQGQCWNSVQLNDVQQMRNTYKTICYFIQRSIVADVSREHIGVPVHFETAWSDEFSDGFRQGQTHDEHHSNQSEIEVYFLASDVIRQ